MSSRNIVIFVLAILLIGFFMFLFVGNNSENSKKSKVAPASVPLPNKIEDHTTVTHNDIDCAFQQGLTQEKVVSIVKKYIDENPEAIMRSIENYYAAKADETRAMQKNIIIKLKDQIYNNLSDPKIGNPKGSIKIVEFFDYACSFCRKMLPINQKIMDDYPDVQIILKELPIMGDWSLVASKAALAVSMIDNNKYSNFHSRLLSIGDRTEDSIMQAAIAEGIDINKMKESMQKVEIEDIIQTNLKLSADLKIRGTPAYIINNNVLPGALSYAEMKSALEAAGAKKASSNDVAANVKLVLPEATQATTVTLDNDTKTAESNAAVNSNVKKDIMNNQASSTAAQ